MTMKMYTLYLLAALSAVVAISGYSEDIPPLETVQAVMDADGKQRIQILSGSYFFTPNRIIVKANVPVELSVKREPGIVPHTFVMKIPEAGIMIDENLSTDAKTIAFTLPAVGKYPFYCRNKLMFFKSHQERGAKGTIEVVP